MTNYFCSYIVLSDNSVAGYGDTTFAVDFKCEDIKQLTDEVKKSIKDKWLSDSDVNIVLTAFNHVELPN